MSGLGAAAVAVSLAATVGLAAAAGPGRVAVPGLPTAIAVVGGSVWLIAGDRVVRVDGATGRVRARIGVGVRVGSERTCDLAVAAGVVWVVGTVDARRSRIVRLDARSGRVLGSTPVPSAACVAATVRGAWVTLPAARTLVRLGRAGQVVQRVPPAPTAIGPWPGAALSGLRARSRRPAHHVLTGELAAGAAGVFASGVGHDSGRTVRVDAPGPCFASSGNLAVGRSSVWVADWRGPGEPGFLRQVNARSGRTIRLVAGGISPVGIALGAHTVWLTNDSTPGELTRISR